MKYKIFKAWEASTTGDDHGTPLDRIGVFTSNTEAAKAARGLGYFGGDGHVEGVHLIEVDGVVYELTSPKPVFLDVNLLDREAKIKQAALAKLTPEEKATLGLE